MWNPQFCFDSFMYITFVVKCLINCFLFLQNRELQIMRKLEHVNIVKLKYFFYSSGDKVRNYFFFVIFGEKTW